MGCIASEEQTKNIKDNSHLNQTVGNNSSYNTKLSCINNDRQQFLQKKRNNVATIAENKRPINGEALILVDKALSKHFLFYGLDQKERYELIRLMTSHTFSKDQYVFYKGDQAEILYIIIRGKAEVETGLDEPKYLQKGDPFGDLALIYETTRSFSVVARSQLMLWGISKETFRVYMQNLKQKGKMRIKNAISKVSIFSHMSQKQKAHISTNSHRFHFKAGSTIFNRQDPANCIFIVIEGRVEMVIENKPKIVYEQGDMFGEGCLMGFDYRFGTARCEVDTECLSINKKVLQQELSPTPTNILFFCICKWTLKRSAIFSLLKKSTIDKIISSGEMRLVKDGKIIQEKGEPTNCMYICLQGKINDQGVGSLFNEKIQDSGSVDLVKNQTGYVFTINLETVNGFLGPPFKTVMDHKESDRKTKVIKEKTLAKNALKFSVQSPRKTQRTKKNKILMEDLRVLDKIKKKQEYELLLVTQNSNNDTRYLLQCLKNPQKSALTTQKLQTYITTLTKLSHPLLPKLIKTFKKQDNSSHIFLLKQHISTTPLSAHILYNPSTLTSSSPPTSSLISSLISSPTSTISTLASTPISTPTAPTAPTTPVLVPCLTIDEAKFYIACVLEIVRYLHENEVVHNGISIQGFVVGGNGYLYADEMFYLVNLENGGFGCSRTKSLSAFPHYLAPEVIHGEIPSKESDLWSIGVFMHRLIYGVEPFGFQSKNPYDIYQAILQGEYPTSKTTPIPNKLQKTMEQLVKKQKSKRMKLSSVISQIGINLAQIRQFRMKAPQSGMNFFRQILTQISTNSKKMVSINDYYSQDVMISTPMTNSLLFNENQCWDLFEEGMQ